MIQESNGTSNPLKQSDLERQQIDEIKSQLRDFTDEELRRLIKLAKEAMAVKR